MAIVERDAGKAFDPKIVATLKKLYVELEQKARSRPLEPWRLSTDINIERGGEPGAGFAIAESRVHSDGVVSPVRESEGVRLGCLLEAVATGVRFLSPAETLSIFSTRLATMVQFDALAIYFRDGNKLVPVHAAGGQAATLQSMRVSGRERPFRMGCRSESRSGQRQYRC